MTRLELLNKLKDDLDVGISPETTLKRLLMALISDEEMAYRMHQNRTMSNNP